MNYALVCLEKTDLAQTIAQKLNQELHVAQVTQFADGELSVSFDDPQQFINKIIIIIQSTGAPVNEHVLSIAFCVHELKNIGAQKIIAVIPYFGYSRQEVSAATGKPGNAQVVIKLLEAAGINELITVELHEQALLNLFSIPVHNVLVRDVIIQSIKENDSYKNACLIAPDWGAHEYVQFMGDMLGMKTITFCKERYAADKTRVMHQDNQQEAQIGIILDDIISTGGTVINVCNELHEQGYKRFYGYFVHPVFADIAIERIKESKFDQIYVSNTLQLEHTVKNAIFIKTFDISDTIIIKLKELLDETCKNCCTSEPYRELNL